MLAPTDDTKKVLKTLRKKLDNLYYDQIQMACRFYLYPISKSLQNPYLLNPYLLNLYFLNPWPTYQIFEETIQELPPVNRLSYELLLLGKTLSMKDVEEIFSRDEIDGLVRIGLLKRDGELVNMGNLSIASFFGRYFIVNNFYRLSTYEQKDKIVYLGFDSYLLAYNLKVPRGSHVLDLGTGSGIQAILASEWAEKVIGVEINDEVANIAACNVALNNVEDKVEIRVGDLYEPVAGEQFDIICSNPPFKPIPQDVEYFRAGDGGPDGLKVINKILNDLNDHLATGGKCYITVTDLIGDENGPLLEKRLRELSEKNRWSTTLLLPYRHPIYYQANETADSAKTINAVSQEELLRRWKKTFEELGVTETYRDVVCTISKVDSFHFNRINLYKHFLEERKPLFVW